MSFDRGRHAATTDRPTPHNRRREHLAALHAAIQVRPDMDGRLVQQRGVSWVNVSRYGKPRRAVNVSCDYRNGGWWFCWLADGSPIARVEDVAGCIDRLTRELNGTVT
ncbi:hypothetical protein Arub01_57070 [Actinomadura rubrobrunea]|uniref:Uncharacterized protein n=1 Tax=Actinomadura rubrobrunea TaxID=115335 RepID=A0A9W6Q2L6_9ACTN|nr:hypothetical protein [Actinomadura rubrobrunea]GLW67464.1 hypothetical protein Arub01_57070 [Actinomadura rubrobrunea]